MFVKVSILKTHVIVICPCV